MIGFLSDVKTGVHVLDVRYHVGDVGGTKELVFNDRSTALPYNSVFRVI